MRCPEPLKLKRTAVAALLILVALVPVSAQRKPSIYLTHSSSTDQPLPPGATSSEAEAASSATLEFLYGAFTDRFPCLSLRLDKDMAALADHQRMRELLGGGGTDEFFAMVAGAVGADNVANVLVNQTGGKFTVTITTFNARTNKVTSRNSKSFQGDDAIDGMEDFAREVAAGYADLRCPQTDLAGTVTISEQFSGSGTNPDGEAFSGSRNMTMNCQLDGWNGSQANCRVSFSTNMTFSGGSSLKEAGQGTVACSINVDVTTSGTTVRIGPFRLKTALDANFVFKDQDGKVTRASHQGPHEMQLGAWEFQSAGAPSASGTISGSGTFGNVRATWNLKPPATR